MYRYILRWINNPEISERQRNWRSKTSEVGLAVATIPLMFYAIAYTGLAGAGYGWNPLGQWSENNPKRIELNEQKRKLEEQLALYEKIGSEYIAYSGEVHGTPSILDVDGDGVELSEVVDAFGKDTKLRRISVRGWEDTAVIVSIPTSDAALDSLVQKYEWGQIDEQK